MCETDESTATAQHNVNGSYSAITPIRGFSVRCPFILSKIKQCPANFIGTNRCRLWRTNPKTTQTLRHHQLISDIRKLNPHSARRLTRLAAWLYSLPSLLLLPPYPLYPLSLAPSVYLVASRTAWTVVGGGGIVTINDEISSKKMENGLVFRYPQPQLCVLSAYTRVLRAFRWLS